MLIIDTVREPGRDVNTDRTALQALRLGCDFLCLFVLATPHSPLSPHFNRVSACSHCVITPTPLHCGPPGSALLSVGWDW